MLEVHELHKAFAGFVAVGGVSLTVETRQIAAVIGPNGAGKSTLFNLITGHIMPDGGRVLLDGRDITGAPPHRMGIGRSFQRTNIFARLSVFENVQAAFLAHRGRGRNFWSRSEDFYREETAALLGSIGPRPPGRGGRRDAELRQPKAARARHRARQRPDGVAARRADRRDVCERNSKRCGCCSASPASAA